MKRTTGRIRLCMTLLVLNLLFIWGNSLLPGEQSSALSHWVKNLLQSFLPVGNMPSGGEGHLRKIAHGAEFACLGMCLRWLFGMLQTRKLPAMLLALLWGAVVACVDETIQVFIPGRGPGIRDVGIDCLGLILGILILSAGNEFVKKYFLNRRNTQ